MRNLSWRLAFLPAALALLGLAAGCQPPSHAEVASQGAQESAEPSYKVVKPARGTVSRQVEQPGFNIEAFQETALHARVSGYVKKWALDMGAPVRKGEVLVELDAPELGLAVRQKEAAIRQAEAQVGQAQAAVLSAQAQQDRAKSQYERIARAGQGGVVDRESVDETRLGLAAAKAVLEKARSDVKAAEAHAEVARADRDYAQAMLDFTQVKAPFDGVITRRNASVGEFVQPAGAGERKPLYVIQQLDPVRVVVMVPGADALWLADGDPASFRLQGAGGELFVGKVTRNANSLDPQSRTLRTEIEVPNPKGRLLPGMYVQASITVQHAGVWTLPASAIATEGDQTFCYRVEGNKAVRTPLQAGLTGGGLVEVVKQQVKGVWVGFGEKDEVVSNPAGLRDGQTVRRAE